MTEALAQAEETTTVEPQTTLEQQLAIVEQQM